MELSTVIRAVAVVGIIVGSLSLASSLEPTEFPAVTHLTASRSTAPACEHCGGGVGIAVIGTSSNINNIQVGNTPPVRCSSSVCYYVTTDGVTHAGNIVGEFVR